jgi:hypothetical protein
MSGHPSHPFYRQNPSPYDQSTSAPTPLDGGSSMPYFDNTTTMSSPVELNLWQLNQSFGGFQSTAISGGLNKQRDEDNKETTATNVSVFAVCIHPLLV